MNDRDFILDSIKRQGSCKIIMDLVEKIFPQPKTTTSEDLELIINEKLGFSSIIDRGSVSHVYQLDTQSQIFLFCKKYGLSIIFHDEERSVEFFPKRGNNE